MTNRLDLYRTLNQLKLVLEQLERRFAMVGGLAVSIRAEVRFTKDIDIVVSVKDDSDAEALIYQLTERGYRPVATVEQKRQQRLATARLESPENIPIDIIFTNCGIEPEILDRASSVTMEESASIHVAAAEELLAMKVLSMTPKRLQDRIDARNLLLFNPEIDLNRVHALLEQIKKRGYDRGQNLLEKIDSLLQDLRSSQ